MGNLFRLPIVAGVMILLLAGALRPAYGNQEASNLFVDGVEAFDAADYKGALQFLEKALALDPENVQFKFYLALVYKEMKEREKALAIFSEIMQKAPAELANVYFEKAAIHKKDKNYAAALETLKEAEKHFANDPAVYLERGQILRESRDYEAAIADFKRAGEVDPEMNQTALYNIAAVYVDNDSFEQAEAMYNKAIELDPESSVAHNARKSMENLDRAKATRKPLSLSLGFAWGYDSNIPLDPVDNITLRPSGQPSNKGDQFQTLNFNAAYKFLKRPDLESGAGYNLRCTGYKEWNDNNLLGHRPYAYVHYNREPYFFKLRYTFNYWYAGGVENNRDLGPYMVLGDGSEKLMRVHSLNPGVIMVHADRSATEANLIYNKLDYLNGVTSDARDLGIELIQNFKLSRYDLSPRLGYKFIDENADNDISSYTLHTAQAGVGFPFLWESRADVSLLYSLVHYAYNPFYAAVGKRDDDQYRIVASLSRTVYQKLNLTLYFDHSINDSDVLDATGYDPYAFHKSVYSLMAHYVF